MDYNADPFFIDFPVDYFFFETISSIPFSFIVFELFRTLVL